MKIIPERTLPASDPVQRRHNPSHAGYERYRACLRWEFGFSCAFCLLHESDLSENGVEGKGLTSVEHAIRQTKDSGLTDDYGNCFYACRFCNRDRGIAPEDLGGASLLDPCSVAWGSRFDAAGDQLIAKSGDRDAAYTESSYRLNSPLIRVAQTLERDLRAAKKQLSRFAAVPVDATAACRCGASMQGLPTFFEAQCSEQEL